MKTLTIVTALLIAAPSLAAEAMPTRHGKRHAYRPAHHFYRAPRSQGPGWYPHDTHELPFGSPRWFDQMLRENRRNAG
jgi:hypothetical protein